MILLDVGNSSIKWCQAVAGDGVTVAAFSAPQLGAVYRCGRSPEQAIQALRENAIAPRPVWIASVAGAEFDAALISALETEGFGPVSRLESPPEQAGLINSYSEPARMGVDRWLAMLGAWEGGSHPVAVIDAGSALTIDLVAADGRHEGGYIIPGIAMMERSLLRDTQRVRFEGAAAATLTPGKSTLECVNAGIWMATFGAIRQVLVAHPDHRVVVTGGDGRALLSLGLNGEWRPNLVLEGLAIAARC